MKKVTKKSSAKKNPFGGKQAPPFGKKAAPKNTGTAKLPKSMSYIAQ